jgi:processive 1,2-diacylglycerol beta-glucosyltransferase
MEKIPVLSAGFGEGHNAAARAVVAALNRHPSGSVQGDFHDLFLEAYGPEKAKSQRDRYIHLANNYPRVWGGLYHALDKIPLVSWTVPLVRPVVQAWGEMLAQTQPKVIVTAYPLYNYFLPKNWKLSDPERPRVITVVTDSMTVNRAWHRAYSDWYVTPNEATAAIMRRQGVPAEKILPYGFPVSDRLRARSQVTATERPRVLLMLNPGRRDAVEWAQTLSGLEIDLTITVGKDADFKQAVEQATAGRAVVLGWTDKIPELMLSSHVVVSKAGGATTHECVAAGVPMIITQVIPGQEAGNARLIVDHGAGAYGLTPTQARDVLQQAFAQQGQVWSQWKAAITDLGDADGADRIADLVVRELATKLATAAA